MMWARIENNRVWELTDIDPEGRFPPGVYNWQPCPDETAVYWAAIEGEDGVWSFAPYVPPPPTPEEILINNQNSHRDRMSSAAAAMAPVLLSLNLGDSTEEEVILARAWQTYYRDLRDMDLTILDPEWPAPPSSDAVG